MRYERQGPDYPLYPGTMMGQVVRRDGRIIQDRIWFPMYNKQSGKTEMRPKLVDKVVQVEFTWYGSHWKRREVLPHMKSEQHEQKAQGAPKFKAAAPETAEERTARILRDLGWKPVQSR